MLGERTFSTWKWKALMVDSVGMSDMKYNNNRTYKTRTQCTWYTDQLHSMRLVWIRIVLVCFRSDCQFLILMIILLEYGGFFPWDAALYKQRIADLFVAACLKQQQNQTVGDYSITMAYQLSFCRTFP